MSTNATFIAALQGMTIAGVARHYDYPPTALNTADLPAAFPILPGGSRVQPVSTCIVDAKVRTMQYGIAVEPVAQNLQANNYALFAALMDNLETALDALDIGMVFTEYVIEVVQSPIAGVDHWLILATITGRNA